MKHHSVYLFLVLTFVIYSQVSGGVILGKIKDTFQDIKCKTHVLGNAIFPHGHHDPCAKVENIHSEGQSEPHRGNDWLDQKHSQHEPNDHQEENANKAEKQPEVENKKKQESVNTEDGKEDEVKLNGVIAQPVSSSISSLDVRGQSPAETSTVGGRTILNKIKANCEDGFYADSDGVCRELY